MRQHEFCNHYRAMADFESCNAGIAYDTFKGLKFDQRPCFQRDGVAPCGCDKQVFPTAEEIAEREKLMAARFQRTGLARKAIVDSLGGPWKRGMDGSSGVIECPNCNGQLSFSRSGYNGHIHARCATEGCCAWME